MTYSEHRYYQQHINGCCDEAARTELDDLCLKLDSVQEEFASGNSEEIEAIIASCRRSDDLPDIAAMAEKIRARYLHVIVCGVGGSGLSGKMLAHLRLHDLQRAPSLHVLDTIDPDLINAIIEHCPAEDSFVITISKSGKTVETISQFYVLFAHFQKILGKKAAENFMIITENSDNPLLQTARQQQIATVEHPKNIGGRFSLFTAVGLLPAALAAIDIKAIRAGASAVAEELKQKNRHPALIGAALQYYHMRSQRNMSVMFLYSERLKGLSAWYRQSWAESLGKSGSGSTPICAIGTTDQHSQLQLYLDGPDDKFFTFITQSQAGIGQKIHVPAFPELDYLHGKTTGDIMESEQKATRETIIAHKRPVRLLEITSLNEESLGALIMHFILEIAFTARLLRVNAFNQPAVEESKRRARDYLSKLTK